MAPVCALAREASPTHDTAQAAAIPWAQLGAQADAQYTGDGLSISATQDGARLRCVFQRLEGEATPEGLWLTSTVERTEESPGCTTSSPSPAPAVAGAPSPIGWERAGVRGLCSVSNRLGSMPADRFRVVATAVGRAGSPLPAVGCDRPEDGAHGVPRPPISLPTSGTVTLAEKMVRFSRPGLVEEYTVSADGVRQDFLVATPPPDAGDLRVTLAASGARVEATPFGARLVLEGSGRKIAYSRLRVTDATGRELPARFDVTAPGHNAGDDGREDGGALPTRRCGELAILVNDANAVYPIRIDPTFSDENWISISPSVPGVGGEVYAAAMDTAGNLYIGGSFISAGSVVANRIAKWDGSSWSALGSGMNNRVWALAVSGSDLYAGGYFTTAGGVSANCVARWNGSSWSALGSGMGGLVYALAVSGSDLYAGGTFTTAGGVAANRIAKWDGSDWSALGSGMNDWVGALAVSGSDLYAGGGFGTAGGVSAQNIAKWNGSSWSPLGSGMNDCVRALAVSGSDLYVGGDFSTAGGVSANYVAKWDGSSWSPLGTGMNDWVGALAVSGSDLYAGGTFTTAGGVEANRIAKWNGSSWSMLGSGMDGPVYSLAVSGSDLYAGGYF